MNQPAIPYRLTQRRRRIQTVTGEIQTSKRRLRNAVVKGAAMLTLGFVTVVVVMRLVMTGIFPEGFVSALTPYQWIRPGITVTSIQTVDCGPRYFSLETREEQCDLNRVGGRLQRVTLTFQHDQVKKVVFIGSGIQMADLVQLWGRPHAIVNTSGLMTLRWEGGIVAYATGGTHFAYQLPIKTVILT